MAEHLPLTVYPANKTPGGFAIDGHAENPRAYPAGTEPAVTAHGDDRDKQTDLAK